MAKGDSIRDSPPSFLPMGDLVSALHHSVTPELHPMAPMPLGLRSPILTLRRVATVRKELRHPLLTIAAPRGGWPSPDFVITSHTNCIKLQHGGGQLLQTALH